VRSLDNLDYTVRPKIEAVTTMPNGLERITFSHDVMGGQACIRDLRVPVTLVLNLMANGATFSDVLGDYEYLEEEDIRQALRYASWAASDQILAL
jgi:uncharacterized protein (DUF433 family)